MKSTIKFDRENSDKRTRVGWTWHYGQVKQADKSFMFCACEMNDSNSGSSAREVFWIDETPVNSADLEKLILTQFEDEFK